LLLLGGSLCKIVANSIFFSTTNGKSHKTSAIQVFKYIRGCTHIHRCCCYDDDDGDVMGTFHRCLSLLSLKVVGPGDFYFFLGFSNEFFFFFFISGDFFSICGEHSF
jgi:hypothetical protein